MLLPPRPGGRPGGQQEGPPHTMLVRDGPPACRGKPAVPPALRAPSAVRVRSPLAALRESPPIALPLVTVGAPAASTAPGSRGRRRFGRQLGRDVRPAAHRLVSTCPASTVPGSLDGPRGSSVRRGTRLRRRFVSTRVGVQCTKGGAQRARRRTSCAACSGTTWSVPERTGGRAAGRRRGAPRRYGPVSIGRSVRYAHSAHEPS